MESKINFQDMPQLVIAKILTFLDHKRLLMLEQVSKQFKCAIENHFRTTDHLILGYLPSIEELEENKKLLQLIQRCGIRLRTIQLNVNVYKQFNNEHYEMDWLQLYIDHLFESGGEVISKTCPNIEHIITSPKLITKSKLFNGQVVGLTVAESYANHLYKMGDKCKLRAISFDFKEFYEENENEFNTIVDCYSNLKHILVPAYNVKFFLRYLPQLIKNGLQDLKIDDYSTYLDVEDIEQYCKIGINLRTLRFTVEFASNDEIASINQLMLPKGLELGIVAANTTTLALLNENVCDSVVKLNYFLIHSTSASTIDCSSLIKLKNLREFEGGRLEHAKVIAKESFPKLKQVHLRGSGWIRCNPCHEAWTLGYRNSACESIFLAELLTSMGHQLTVISMDVCSSLELVVKAVKNCKAALNVDLSSSLNLDLCTSSITIEDIIAILQLPRLQKFRITYIVRDSSHVDDLKQKMKIAEIKQTFFKFDYHEINIGRCQRSYTFDRIDIYEQ